MCRFFAKNGKCRFGNKCQYSHVRQLADLYLGEVVADISRMWCQKGTRRARSLRSTGTRTKAATEEEAQPVRTAVHAGSCTCSRA